jgi:hypothetical protein
MSEQRWESAGEHLPRRRTPRTGFGSAIGMALLLVVIIILMRSLRTPPADGAGGPDRSVIVPDTAAVPESTTVDTAQAPVDSGR